MPATNTAAKIVIAHAAEGNLAREIFRNGVLVGTCVPCVADWCGPNGRRDRWWQVTSVTGHVYRDETATLADVRALFA